MIKDNTEEWNRMYTETVYGFLYKGEDQFHLLPIDCEVGFADKIYLAHMSQAYLAQIPFVADYCLLRELKFLKSKQRKGNPAVNSPSRLGEEKYQAFIFKRKSQHIASNAQRDIYSIDERQLTLDFSFYEVTVVEVED